MTISDEAVDAAFAQLPDDFMIHSRGAMRRMLAAAAPYMLAGAWDEGAEESADHWAQTARNPNPNGPTDPPRNPYRSQP